MHLHWNYAPFRNGLTNLFSKTACLIFSIWYRQILYSSNKWLSINKILDNNKQNFIYLFIQVLHFVHNNGCIILKTFFYQTLNNFKIIEKNKCSIYNLFKKKIKKIKTKKIIMKKLSLVQDIQPKPRNTLSILFYPNTATVKRKQI